MAAPLGESSNLDLAISIGVSGALNALKACAKTPSCKRFVYTSSSIAATFPHPDVEVSIEENTYNEEALEILKEGSKIGGLGVYAAMKTASEKAAAKWVQENKPGFVFNAVVSRVSKTSDTQPY